MKGKEIPIGPFAAKNAKSDNPIDMDVEQLLEDQNQEVVTGQIVITAYATGKLTLETSENFKRAEVLYAIEKIKLAMLNGGK